MVGAQIQKLIGYLVSVKLEQRDQYARKHTFNKVC